jgi:hypothetical protein
MLEIDLEELSLRCTTFGESVRSWIVPEAVASSEQNQAAKKFVPREHEGLKQSLLYYLNRCIVISDGYRVYGYGATVFIEGMQSLTFRKFKLDQGADAMQTQGAGIDKIWYYPSQGAVINGYMNYEKAVKAGTARTGGKLNLSYDLLGNGDNPRRGKIAFTSDNALDLSRRSSLIMKINAITGNMFNVRLGARAKWVPGLSSEFSTDYSRTAAGRDELWLRLDSRLEREKLGSLSLDFGYEKERQYRGALSLRNQALKNVSFSLRHSFSYLLFDGNTYNRQGESAFSLTYSHRLFEMAADYSFHRDLLREQSQGMPRFTLKAMPFRLYDGLLRLDLAANFMVNRLTVAGRRDNQSLADMVLNLQSEPIRLGPGPAVSVALSAEQLLEEEWLNRFTSMGCVLRCTQNIASFADLDFMYNYNTRRRTETWLIQGSSSQDWSAVLRPQDISERFKGWISLSYDSKNGHFTNSYLDCTLSLFKNWQVQTQMNYDFIFRNLNYDLYLIRHAGRIMFRASYRSLSRKFLVEILPADGCFPTSKRP